MICTILRFFAVAALLAAAAASLPLRAQIKIPTYPVDGIAYEPLPVVFALAPRGTVKESFIEIINRKPEPLEITGIENPSTRFAARIETLEAGRRFRLTVTLKGEGPSGKQSHVLLLKTNLASAPVLKIPVNTFVQEKVYTFPESVFLGRFGISEIKGKTQASRGMAQILMVYRKGRPGFDIKVTSDVPFLKIESELGPKGDQWENTIWLDAERAEPGEIKGTIFIETNDPDIPKLSVPVTGRLLPK
ncbi:MAG: hypothetical protein JJE04_09370 [Acidobacteriia bacterium]|nr:hypothetical protein [Terriglobia bacterium]